MKRTSIIIGLCLAAVGAFSAIGASTASAEVLWKFSNGGFPGSFTGSGNTTATLKSTNGNITCSKNVDKGTVEDAHLGKVTILFEGCETEILFTKYTCQTKEAGDVGGHITLKEWVWHLGLAHDETTGSTEVPAILILIPGGSFSFECTKGTSKVSIKVTGVGAAGLLEKSTAKEDAGMGLVKSLNLVFSELPTRKPLFPLFLLSLGLGTVTNLQLESENSILKTKETSAQISTSSLEGFKNSAGEEVEVELELV